MIPVTFHGRTVGWLPPIAVREHAPIYYVPLYSPPPPSRCPADGGSIEPPRLEVVEFTIVDRRANGVFGELRVNTLSGLLRVPGFVPEDWGLAEMSDQR